jgi:hypothetical protein
MYVSQDIKLNSLNADQIKQLERIMEDYQLDNSNREEFLLMVDIQASKNPLLKSAQLKTETLSQISSLQNVLDNAHKEISYIADNQTFKTAIFLSSRWPDVLAPGYSENQCLAALAPHLMSAQREIFKLLHVTKAIAESQKSAGGRPKKNDYLELVKSLIWLWKHEDKKVSKSANSRFVGFISSILSQVFDESAINVPNLVDKAMKPKTITAN